MAGLLGFMAAGAAKGYSEGRGKELAQKQDFDLKLALLDAQIDKELRLKEAGYQMDDKRAAAEMERNKGYMTGENGEELSPQEAGKKAMKDGNFETGKGLLALTPKETKFKDVKLDDGSIVAFNESTGETKIALKGGGEVSAPKNEFDLAWRISGGDPKKAAAILVEQKSKISAAGRAPTKASDDDQSYADWKRKPQNKEKGRDDYMKEKASWGKADNLNRQRVTEKPLINELTGAPVLGKDGKPIIQRSVTRDEEIGNDPLGIR